MRADIDTMTPQCWEGCKLFEVEVKRFVDESTDPAVQYVIASGACKHVAICRNAKKILEKNSGKK